MTSNNAITLDLQIAYQTDSLPTQEQIELWLTTTLSNYQRSFELTIRIVDNQESQTLNHQYRNKDKPTNVLSFPFELPDGIELDLLGDLVICAPIVEQEAKQQNKPLIAHWAHMIIHGCLHLLGYDHINDNEAEEMETLEIKLLAQLGFNNPYQEY